MPEEKAGPPLSVQAAWPRGNSNTSAETATPLRSADLAAIGAMVLDSPRVLAVPSDLAPGSSAGSSIDEEAGAISPDKMGPTNFELLRVVGQGAFGKVSPCFLSQRIPALLLTGVVASVDLTHLLMMSSLPPMRGKFVGKMS